MNDSLENILNELYVIDPSLKEYKGDIRVLVRAVLESKPTVEISENFVLNLRKSLLNRATHTVSTRSPMSAHKSISWWAYRLTPIGVLAVLVLMLIPGAHKSSNSLPTIQEPVLREMDTRATDMHDTNASQSESIEMSAQERDAGGDSMMFKANAPAMDAYVVNEETKRLQNPIILNSVTLERPGFVVVEVVFDSTVTEVVGVSNLLQTGTTAGVYIHLLRTIYSSEPYKISVYADNGDRIFDPQEDIVPLATDVPIP